MSKMLRNFAGILIVFNTFSIIDSSILPLSIKYCYAKEYTSVYLKNIKLSRSDIDFSEDVYYYTAVVNRDYDDIKITARPKSEDAFVTINDDEVNKDNNYRETIDLNKGNNIVKIKVTNDDNEEKVYTINIIKGEGENDEVYLNKLMIDDKNINLSRDEVNYDFSVSKDIDEVYITAEPENDMSEVSIDGGNADKENKYTQRVELKSGINPILIKVKDKKDDDARDYLININKKETINNNNTNDDIYLDYINLDGKRIQTDKDSKEYNLQYAENTSGLYVQAEPEDTKYKVIINNKIVEISDNYKEFVDLKKGSNVITIRIQDLENNKERVYRLNINVGNVQDNNLHNSSIYNEIKYNQWIENKSGWQYYDASGNIIKNNWFYDINNGREYYFNENGIMATNWLSLNGKWYYLGQDGSKEKGWQHINNKWYYFDDSGVMQTGWIEDINADWYYLNANGEMESNCVINGYKLNSNGVLV